MSFLSAVVLEFFGGLACRIHPQRLSSAQGNVLARALGAAGEVETDVHHLAIGSTPGRAPDASLPPVETPATGGPPTLKILEGQAIVQVLRESRGNRTQAARALGIDRSTLRRKLQELDIRS